MSYSFNILFYNCPWIVMPSQTAQRIFHVWHTSIIDHSIRHYICNDTCIRLASFHWFTHIGYMAEDYTLKPSLYSVICTYFSICKIWCILKIRIGCTICGTHDFHLFCVYIVMDEWRFSLTLLLHDCQRIKPEYESH